MGYNIYMFLLRFALLNCFWFSTKLFNNPLVRAIDASFYKIKNFYRQICIFFLRKF